MDGVIAVICPSEKQVPRRRNTKIYHSFCSQRPQARNQRRRDPGELRVQVAPPSGHYAGLLLPFEWSKRQ
jgi:hypothetical protein